MESNAHGHNGEAPGHEKRDADIRLILTSTVALIIATGIVLYLMVLSFDFFKAHTEPGAKLSPLASPNQAPPGPLLTDRPYQELINVHAHEDRILSSYGWVDQKNGVTRIPIDRAMDLVAKRGLPMKGDAKPKPTAKKGGTKQ